MKFIFALLITTFATSAFAFDESRCPQSFTLSLSRTTAYKTSVYSDVTGWKEVTAKLAAETADRTWTFDLTPGKMACYYKSATGETARVYGSMKQDIELGGEYEVVNLSVYFKIDGEKFSIFPDLYLENGFELFKTKSTERSIIRTPLESNGRIINFDVGLTEVNLVLN